MKASMAFGWHILESIKAHGMASSQEGQSFEDEERP
jgi:hypothetical protein